MQSLREEEPVAKTVMFLLKTISLFNGRNLNSSHTFLLQNDECKIEQKIIDAVIDQSAVVWTRGQQDDLTLVIFEIVSSDASAVLL